MDADNSSDEENGDEHKDTADLVNDAAAATGGPTNWKGTVHKDRIENRVRRDTRLWLVRHGQRSGAVLCPRVWNRCFSYSTN